MGEFLFSQQRHYSFRLCLFFFLVVLQFEKEMSFLRSKSRRPSAGPAVDAAAAAPEIVPPPPATTDAAAAAAGGNGNGKTAAVVGSGISGLATAWLLQQ